MKDENDGNDTLPEGVSKTRMPILDALPAFGEKFDAEANLKKIPEDISAAEQRIKDAEAFISARPDRPNERDQAGDYSPDRPTRRRQQR